MMEEKRVCQSCKGEFAIAAEDFVYYEKIQVPAPTWCPECRAERRKAYYLNLMKPKMYARKCDATGKDIISMYPPYVPFPVYDRSYWMSDKWDPRDLGKKYDFSRSFFEQFYELQKAVPRYHVFNKDSENCEYCKIAQNSKNCYLVTGWGNENSLYTSAAKAKECVDSFGAMESELCYSCVTCTNCYGVSFSQYAEFCTDSAFLYDCKNCTNCFGCVNLRNKSYYIFNKPYTKQEYEQEMKKYDLRNHETIISVQEKFDELKKSMPQVFARITKSENVTGNDFLNSKNVQNGFTAWGTEDSKYINLSFEGLKDSYDTYDTGVRASFLYEVAGAGGDSNHIYFSNFVVWNISNVMYSESCTGISDCFGCVGMRKGSYCILNKQYTKQEYEELVPKIIQQMKEVPYVDALGRKFGFGEFFPPELSLVSYDDSIAYIEKPLTMNEAKEKGYAWFDSGEQGSLKHPQTSEPADSFYAPDESILTKTLTDKAGHNYKIIQQELNFYTKIGLPIPRECPTCRFLERMKLIPKTKIVERACSCQGDRALNPTYNNAQKHSHGGAPCPEKFMTVYAEGPFSKSLYCEKCFQDELIS